MKRAVSFALTVGLLLVLSLPFGKAQQAVEPPAPSPATSVQMILDEVAQLAQAKKPQEALVAAERALAAAQAAGDAAGEAHAERARATALQTMNRPEEAVTAWRAAAAAWGRADDGPGGVEALAQAGLLLAARKSEEADALVALALAMGRGEAKRPLAAATVLTKIGNSYYQQGRLKPASELYRGALDIREKLAPDSLDVAASLNNLGVVTRQQGDLAAAREYHQRTLAIREKLAPDSLDQAASLNNLGGVAGQQGDLAMASDYFRRALALQEKLAPDSLDVAASLYNLGAVESRQGNLAEARDYHRRALAIKERRAANSLTVAISLTGLGIVVRDQGDLAAARDYFQRALSIRENQAPDSLAVATSLTNLGGVARQQGDVVAASDYFQRALSIQEKQAPDSRVVAESLTGLGIIARQQGDMMAARDYFQRALSIREKQAPDSLAVAKTLISLGNVEYGVGDPAAAREHFERALALQERQAPGSLDAAASLTGLGAVAWQHRDLSVALDHFQRALAIWEKQAPDSLGMARSLNNLGQLAAKKGDLVEAERLALRAWELVRQQSTTVIGDEGLQAFGAFTAFYAANLVRYQLALGKTDGAFRTLEEGRAQAMLQLLLERDVLAPATNNQLWLEYQAALAGRDRAEQALSQANTAEARAQKDVEARRKEHATPEGIARAEAEWQAAKKKFAAAQSDYTRARVKADQSWTEIKKKAPRAFPAPLTLAEAHSILPLDMLFVAFSVGEEQTHLFLLRGGSSSLSAPSVYTLELSAKDLQTQIYSLRALIADPTSSLPKIVAACRSLFARLFPEAARATLSGAQRWLISPDGPLLELPFAALVTNSQGSPRYLGAHHALTYTQSLTLFAQACRDGPSLVRGRAPVALVVGDPLFERASVLMAAASSKPRVRGERSLLFSDGKPPAPLPETRNEALQIARLYGAQPLLGKAATEAAVRYRIPEADVVHLATHGYLHSVRAMSSGVLLTAPENEPAVGETHNDGALQAWEVYSQLRLRAEIVVLAACETGRGQAVAGEGLIGLTRALQYAGARSVMASQWKVADRSTQLIMVALHRNLRKGMAKDEALRRAMASLRQHPAMAHPYFWSSFVLMGDPGNHGLGPVSAP